MDVKEANLRRYDYQHSTQGDPTMETPLILKNLDNGTITQDAALDLMLEHTSRAYAIGAYLDAHRQCIDLRKQLHALQGSTRTDALQPGLFRDLIDHALATDHISYSRAVYLLIGIGMHEQAAHHHADTINIIKDRDLERSQYLDNPETAPRYCTRCGRKVKAHELSRRALCVKCSAAAVEENLIALDTKKGPAYQRWRNAMLVWAYTLEDEEIAERPKMDAGTLGDYIETPIIGPWNSCPGNCSSCNVANCPERDCDYCGDTDQ